MGQSRAGDLLWAEGRLEEARQHFQQCVDEADGCEFVLSAGSGGLTRLHFVHGEYADCIAAFRRGCPPHAFYVEQRELDTQKDSYPDGVQRAQAREALVRKFPGTAPYFLPKAQYMCRAIVLAALRAGGIDDGLRELLVDYFEIDHLQIAELGKALAGNDDAVAPLQKRLAPKPVASGRTFERLLSEGDTEVGRKVRDALPRCPAVVNATAVLLDDFLETADPACMDEMIAAGSPFGIPTADALVLADVLESRREAIANAPACRLALLRRFFPICRYPKYDFLTDYLEVMGQTRAGIVGGDLIAAMLDLQWYKTPYPIDDTGPMGRRGGFGKTEISENREWLEILLCDHPEGFDRAHLATRDQAVAMLHRTYLFLRDRYNQIRRDDRWISEAQLGKALSTLFGEADVQRHARPIWLSPQHLDYFLPRYRLAVEYMGAQHFQPVEVFGGTKALEDTRVRDERKRDLCARMGIALIYVTHEEDIGRRAKEIY